MATQSLAQIVSSVPPVPQTVLDTVAKAWSQVYTDWANPQYAPYKFVPQIITALVLLEQSPAGKAWGVSLAAIHCEDIVTSDKRYSSGYGGRVDKVEHYVECFFLKSGLSETAPMATVTWSHPEVVAGNAAVGFLCNNLRRMLYAAQEFQSPENKLEEDTRLAAMEKRIGELEAHTAALSLELKQLQATAPVKIRAPIVTCLMQLFAGYTRFTCSICDPLITGTGLHSSHTPGGASGGGFVEDIAGGSTTGGAREGAHNSSSHARPSFNIAPHTDRLADLNVDAQNWIWEQLNTRSIWVRATSADSDDNHISWTPFSGAVELGKSVIFSHGNHRFW